MRSFRMPDLNQENAGRIPLAPFSMLWYCCSLHDGPVVNCLHPETVVWLNTSQRSWVLFGMNRLARYKCFERSNELDTALYTTTPLPFTALMLCYLWWKGNWARDPHRCYRIGLLTSCWRMIHWETNFLHHKCCTWRGYLGHSAITHLLTRTINILAASIFSERSKCLGMLS